MADDVLSANRLAPLMDDMPDARKILDLLETSSILVKLEFFYFCVEVG